MNANRSVIEELLSPGVMAVVDPALAELGIHPLARAREVFTRHQSWVELFGSTAGPFLGVGGAAMTNFRLTVVHSPAAMILFANNERYGQPRLYGVSRFDKQTLDDHDWAAFTRVSTL